MNWKLPFDIPLITHGDLINKNLNVSLILKEASDDQVAQRKNR